ncbi:hypothetical protein MBLNU230_g8409t1 [Neophaeotheca triangularis]
MAVGTLKQELERNERLKAMLADFEKAENSHAGTPLRDPTNTMMPPAPPPRLRRQPSMLSQLADQTSNLELAASPVRGDNATPDPEPNGQTAPRRFIRAGTPMPDSGAAAQDIVEDRVRSSIAWPPTRGPSEGSVSLGTKLDNFCPSALALLSSQSEHGISTYIPSSAFRNSFMGFDSCGAPLRLDGEARGSDACGESPTYHELRYRRPGGLSEPLTGDDMRALERKARKRDLRTLRNREKADRRSGCERTSSEQTEKSYSRKRRSSSLSSCEGSVSSSGSGDG